jgi:hypothetical protein
MLFFNRSLRLRGFTLRVLLVVWVTIFPVSASAKNLDVGVLLFSEATSWSQTELPLHAQSILIPRGCPMAAIEPSAIQQPYTISAFMHAVCFYRFGVLIWSTPEGRELQYIQSSDGNQIWVISADRSAVEVNLLHQGWIRTTTFPKSSSSYRISGASSSRATPYLALRREDGRALKVIAFDPGPSDFIEFDRNSAPSEYFKLNLRGDLEIEDTCNTVSSLAPITINCDLDLKDMRAPIYKVGDCQDNRPPILYLPGGPLTPSFPLARFRSLQFLSDRNQQQDRVKLICMWLPMLATSQDSITLTSFGRASAEAQWQTARTFGRIEATLFPAVGQKDTPRLIVAESYGAQLLRPTLEQNGAMDILFFSALLDEVKFARNRGALLTSPEDAGLAPEILIQLRESAARENRANLNRQSEWRWRDFFEWLEKPRVPILLKACQRHAFTRIVVLSAEGDTRAQIDPQMRGDAEAACRSSGNELEFVTAQGIDHATNKLAEFGIANSLLIKEMFSHHTGE